MNEIQPVTHELINELRRKEHDYRQKGLFMKANDIHYAITNIKKQRLKWLQEQRQQDYKTSEKIRHKIAYHKKMTKQMEDKKK